MNRESKEIFERQNLPGLVAAQKTASNCYSTGKLWSALLVFFFCCGASCYKYYSIYI